MNRNVVAALSIAAVLGTTGGVGTALARGHHPTAAAPPGASSASGTPTPGPSDSPTPTTPAETNEPLLWATARTIHDGSRRIAMELPGTGPLRRVDKVVRMKGGYVVAQPTSTQEAAYDLWWVPLHSTASRFAHVVGGWDADPTGQQVVGQAENGRVVVWTPRTGAARPWGTDPHGVAYVGFQGQQVLISLENNADGAGWQLVEWDPATGRTSNPDGAQRGDTVSVGYPQLGLSPGGSYLTGVVAADGAPDLNGGCLHLQSTRLKKQHVSWDTCDWRGEPGPPTFSPDGTRLLVVPKDSDGFGPGSLTVVDASDGPGHLVGSFATPTWTLGAQWADNDHLYVFGSLTDDPGVNREGTFVDRCSLHGECHRVLLVKGMATVGSTP